MRDHGGSILASKRKLLGIQCLRALAAVAVVVSHCLLFEQKYEVGSPIAPHAVEYGMAGVDLFFVISGFIIATVTAGRFDRPGEAAHFLRQRFIRIYPIYWIYSLAVLAVFLVEPEIVNSNHGKPDLLRSFLLLPQQNLPLLLVAWTLVYEMFFYLVFSLALFVLRESQLMLALLAWATIIVAGNLLIDAGDNAFLNLVFSPLILEFIAGCFVAFTLPRLGSAAGLVCSALGLAGFVFGSAVLSASGIPFPLGWGRVLVYGTSSVFLVAGILGLERGRWRIFPGPAVALGDASYSLYLSHILVLAAVGHVWARLLAGGSPLNHVAALTVAIMLAITWGLLSFRLIERPLLQWLQSWIRRTPAVAAMPLGGIGAGSK